MVPPPGRVCASLEACSRFVSSGFGGRCPLSLALTAYLPPSPPFGVAPRGSPPLLSGGSHVCVTTSGTASPFSGALPAFSSRHGFSRFSPSLGIGSPPAAGRLLHPLGLRRLPTSHFLGNVSRLLYAFALPSKCRLGWLTGHLCSLSFRFLSRVGGPGVLLFSGR